MKRRAIMLACVFACLAGGLWAFEWPVSDPKPVRLFGQRSAGVIERGITVATGDTVRAAGYGTVLVTLASNTNMDGFPGTLGNAVLVAHDEGLVSVYGNLESTDTVSERVQIESPSILSRTGTSGWGSGPELVFQIIDSEKKTLLNPLLLLPALKDTRGTMIKNVVAVSASGQTHPLGTVKAIRQGSYRLYADVTDTMDGPTAELSPFRISVLVNGSEYAAIPFELLRENRGQLFLSAPEYSWDRLYTDPERTFLGELKLTRGKTDISIIARDIAGNERSVLFGLQVE